MKTKSMTEKLKDNIKKQAELEILYENENEALEELHNKVYLIAREIGEYSELERDEIKDEEIRNVCSIAFRKGFEDGYKKAMHKMGR